MSFQDIGYVSKVSGVLSPRQYVSTFIDGDDFMLTPVTAEDYVITQSSAGTAALDASAENGVILLDCASSTVVQGIQMQRTSAQFKPKAGREIYFECRLKVADSATGPQFFAGLAEVDTTIIAASAVSTANHIAFTSISTDNILLANAEKGGVGDTTTGTTLVEATYVVLGIKVSGLDKITYYVDGVAVSEIDTTANVPIVALAPSFVCQSSGTTDPIVHLDYWICQQTR